MKTEYTKKEALEGLRGEARKIAGAIFDFAAANEMREDGKLYTGGGKPFFTAKEWREKGMEYGTDSKLIILHEGSDLTRYFNLDYCCYDDYEEMFQHLRPLGVFAEQCTSCYTAIYEV